MRTKYLENPSRNKTLLIVTTLILSLSVLMTSLYTVYSQFQVSCEYCFHFWRHGFKSQSLIWPKIWKPCQVTELKLSKKKTFCWKEDDDKFIMIFFLILFNKVLYFLPHCNKKEECLIHDEKVLTINGKNVFISYLNLNYNWRTGLATFGDWISKFIGVFFLTDIKSICT